MLKNIMAKTIHIHINYKLNIHFLGLNLLIDLLHYSNDGNEGITCSIQLPLENRDIE